MQSYRLAILTGSAAPKVMQFACRVGISEGQIGGFGIDIYPLTFCLKGKAALACGDFQAAQCAPTGDGLSSHQQLWLSGLVWDGTLDHKLKELKISRRFGFKL